MPTLPLPIVLAMLATPFCLGVPTTNKITKRITTPYFKKYTAIGDSYSSGIGAGQYIDPAMSEGWKCSRFTEAYPQQLHKGLNDPDKRTFNFKSCAGATAEQIREQHVDQDADLITLSAGGNNVGFSNLINGCVYRFLGYGSPACEKAMDETEAAIRDDTKLYSPVWNNIFQIKSDLGPNARDARLFVTGYARFFNADTTQCNDASFSYWALPGWGDKMTQARRKRLNDLVILMNQRLKAAVDSWTSNPNGENYWPNVQFVDYDAAFNGHRLCENGVNEPQKWKDTQESHNPNAWFFQISKTSNTDSLAGDNGPGRQWAAWIHEAKANNASLQLNPAYVGYEPVDPGNDFSGGYPLVISKVFHPTGPGHKAVADAIQAQMSNAIQSAQSHIYGDIQYGPSKFTQSLSPGDPGTITDIKDGCYIVIPKDNTVPTQVCD